LAKKYGIYGFCYYHYWFNGKRLLERPFNEILENGKPDFPFMLCWANENWTRKWDGGDKVVLIQQNYNEDDDRNHIHYLLNNVFCDSRYIKINGKPIFSVYKSSDFPNIKRTLSIWREEAKKIGMELYICRIDANLLVGKNKLDGFDAAIEFQPFASLGSYLKKKINFFYLINKITYKFFGENFLPLIVSYRKFVTFKIKQPLPDYKIFPGITPMWDNAARKKRNYFLMYGSRPNLYGKWLSSIVKKFVPYSEEENLLFINAWNEWAEGNHLEPDRKWKDMYLIETKRALQNMNE